MRESSCPRIAQQGFTLVEMSIVLIIIALIVGMTIGSGIYVIGSARAVATQKKMAVIDQALMAYRIAHNQLPCPSDLTQVQGGSTTHTAAYGVAGTCAIASPYHTSITGSSPWGVRTSNNTAGTAVAVAEGGVPTYDLGLPYDFMYDGWGNRIRYAVDVTMANTGSNTNTFTGTQVGAICGAITIQGDPMPVTSAAYGTTHNYTRSSGAIYALISHGPNGAGAFTQNGVMNAVNTTSNLDEQANCNCNGSGTQNTYVPTYVQEQPYTYDTTNPLKNFDDIVTYKERWQLQAANDTPGNSCPRVYVADYSNNRIQVFDMNGNYLSQFGSSGHGNTQFTKPIGMFVDNASNLWVPDSGYNRIQKYALSPSGTPTYVTTVGTGGTTQSTASGQFYWPESAIVDSSGNLWVLDTSNCRVQELNSSLTFVMGIGASYNGITGSVGTCGYATGQFYGLYDGIGGATGMTIDPAGNIWVADTNNNRIEEFSSSGTWLQSLGKSCQTAGWAACTAASGTGSPQFDQPEGIFADKFGNIWIADASNNRIVELNNSGAWITSFSTGAGTVPTGVAVDPSGNVWVSNWTANNIKKCANNAGTWSCTTYGSGGSGNDEFSNPVNLVIPQAR